MKIGCLEVPKPSYPPYFDQPSEISQPLWDLATSTAHMKDLPRDFRESPWPPLRSYINAGAIYLLLGGFDMIIVGILYKSPSSKSKSTSAIVSLDLALTRGT